MFCNNEDVINFEFILYQAYNLLIEKEPVYLSPLEFPKKNVKNPFLANKQVVEKILGNRTSLHS